LQRVGPPPRSAAAATHGRQRVDHRISRVLGFWGSGVLRFLGGSRRVLALAPSRFMVFVEPSGLG
jgi:hypothetical protein